ncbi:hypothetical protein JCM18899A_21260 [Nocardioides sp. AN3]
MQTDTSGGSIDTLVYELATIPSGLLSTTAQMAVTPEGKQPKVPLSSWVSRPLATVVLISMLPSFGFIAWKERATARECSHP